MHRRVDKTEDYSMQDVNSQDISPNQEQNRPTDGWIDRKINEWMAEKRKLIDKYAGGHLFCYLISVLICYFSYLLL